MALCSRTRGPAALIEGPGAAGNHCSLWVLTYPIWSRLQEPDYGALYEGRNPGFYVEANPMPTFKVQHQASGTGNVEAGGPQPLRACISVLRGPSVVVVEKWCLWFSEA